MELNEAQRAILGFEGSLRIQAVAGSGKTATLLAYAQSRPRASRILYLAFNKTVKEEAASRFATVGLAHIRVETAHSLAYQQVVKSYGYQVKPTAYTNRELIKLLDLSPSGNYRDTLLLAGQLSKIFTYFCNSAHEHAQVSDYLNSLEPGTVKDYVKEHQTRLQRLLSKWWSKMEEGKCAVTHDFYLKKFQLTKPMLPFDYVLFDEAQDASAVMMEILKLQTAVVVLAGDEHQQIYGWRHAVNAMQQCGFPSFPLSASYRFGSDIADLANTVLRWKKHLAKPVEVEIQGLRSAASIQSKAIIGRSNMGLLMEAIRRTTDPTTPLSRVFFEGQFSSYAYAEDGASLYDLLHLMNQEKHLIKDPLIAGMNHLYELEAYLETAEDHTLRMMLNMVLEYGNALPGLLQQLRNKQVPPAEKHTAEMIFSTAHRCKGMEYDEVTLLPDFISEDKLEKLKRDVLLNPLQLMRLEEEINLLYVAITRCRERLYLPELLLPQSFHPGPSITVLKTVLPATPSVVLPPEPMSRPLKQKWQQEELRYTLPDMHQVSPNPIKNPPRWTARQDELLLSLFRAGQSTPAMAKQLRRSKDAVRQRLKKLLNAIG